MKHINTNTTNIAKALRLITLALLAAALCASLIACSSPKTAKLDGYDGESFWEALENICEREEKEDGVKAKLTVEKGWDESEELDEDDLSKNEKAYSYIVVFSEDGEDLYATYFFARLDEKSNTLEILSMRDVNLEYDYEWETTDEDDIRSMLEYIMEG